jgi:hypothetical protein
MKVLEVIALNEVNPLKYLKGLAGDAVDTVRGKATHGGFASGVLKDNIEKAYLARLKEINLQTGKAPKIVDELEKLDLAKEALGAKVRVNNKLVDIGSSEHLIPIKTDVPVPGKPAVMRGVGPKKREVSPAVPGGTREETQWVRWDSLPVDHPERVKVQQQIDALPNWVLNNPTELKKIYDDAYKKAKKAYDAERTAVTDRAQKEKDDAWEKNHATFLNLLRRGLLGWNVEETFISPLETLRSELERARDLSPNTVWDGKAFKKVSPAEYQQWYNNVVKVQSQVCAAQIATNIILVFGLKGAAAAGIEKFTSLLKFVFRITGKTPANLTEILKNQATAGLMLTALNTSEFSNWVGSLITEYASTAVVGANAAAYLATLDGVAGTILKSAGVLAPSQIGQNVIQNLKKPNQAPVQPPVQQPNQQPVQPPVNNTPQDNRTSRLQNFN